VIVLSRLDKDNACEEQENRIISHVNRSLERIGCTRRIEKEVIAKDWDMLIEEDFAQIQNRTCYVKIGSSLRMRISRGFFTVGM